MPNRAVRYSLKGSRNNKIWDLRTLAADSNDQLQMEQKQRHEDKATLIELLHENQSLKNSLVETQKQCEFFKKTLKYTEVNELKIENKILNEELVRLRKIVESSMKSFKTQNTKHYDKISEIK